MSDKVAAGGPLLEELTENSKKYALENGLPAIHDQEPDPVAICLKWEHIRQLEKQLDDFWAAEKVLAGWREVYDYIEAGKLNFLYSRCGQCPAMIPREFLGVPDVPRGCTRHAGFTRRSLATRGMRDMDNCVAHRFRPSTATRSRRDLEIYPGCTRQSLATSSRGMPDMDNCVGHRIHSGPVRSMQQYWESIGLATRSADARRRRMQQNRGQGPHLSGEENEEDPHLSDEDPNQS